MSNNVYQLRPTGTDVPAGAVCFDQTQPQAVEGAKERRVADIEEGYTRIANELLDALVEADLTKHQYKVMLAMVRKTYGFNKAFDRITNTQIADMTGIHHTHICKAKNELIDRGLLVNSGRAIGVNKVVSDWKLKVSKNSKSLAEEAKQSLAETANKVKQKQLNTKDTTQKTKDKISSSEIADAIPDADMGKPVSAVAKVRSGAAVQSPGGQKWGTADDLKAAEWIHSRAVVTSPTLKAPNWADWANHVRLMRMQDKRTHREICELYDWVSRDQFWSANVLCPATLRKQWDKLEAKRLARVSHQPSGGMVDPNDTSWIHGDWGF